ncbi:hypothetical protein PtrM4_147590 [Pyrenophora tritici-repentis]|uniref:Uncharacterized protein n=1 Tax=Pyrenophora tritici-repentis TaxID=45151 RepID=A0A834VKP1_9PLEO|nr:hypothetical protein PtrM4_147590 [Pyrenophora tritici-repentis]
MFSILNLASVLALITHSLNSSPSFWAKALTSAESPTILLLFPDVKGVYMSTFDTSVNVGTNIDLVYERSQWNYVGSKTHVRPAVTTRVN